MLSKVGLSQRQIMTINVFNEADHVPVKTGLSEAGSLASKAGSGGTKMITLSEDRKQLTLRDRYFITDTESAQ